MNCLSHVYHALVFNIPSGTQFMLYNKVILVFFCPFSEGMLVKLKVLGAYWKILKDLHHHIVVFMKTILITPLIHILIALLLQHYHHFIVLMKTVLIAPLVHILIALLLQQYHQL